MIKINELYLRNKEETLKYLREAWNKNYKSLENIFEFNRIINPGKKYLPPVGICLRNSENKIVGFLGFLSHQSKIHNGRWLINLTSWIVNSEYRNYSLKLIFYILKDKKKIITNFSATKEVEIILSTLGFKQIDDSENTYFTLIPSIKSLVIRKKIFTGKNAINLFNKTKHKKIMEEHMKIGCLILSIGVDQSKNLGIILLKTEKYLQILYLTDPKLIQIPKIWNFLCKTCLIHWKFLYIKLDGRYAPNFTKPYKKKMRKMFVFGLNKNELIPSRAYSEPIQKYGNF